MKKSIILFIIAQAVIFSTPLMAQTVKVAHQKDYYPYSWMDDSGKPMGLLIDWWMLWATKAGVELEFIAGSTDECIEWVVNEDADAVAGLFFQDGPKAVLEYSEFIMRMNTVLCLKKGYTPRSVHEIDKSIGIIENELSHQILLSKYPDLDLKYFSTFHNLKKSIDDLEIDGFVYEFPNLISEVGEVKAPKGYYKYLVVREDRIRPAVKEGNAALLKLLMTGSAQITNIELYAIVEGNDLFKKPFSIYWIILILILVILVLSVIAYKLYRTQKNRLEQPGILDNNELKMLIEKGENDGVEFKSSFRWDYRQEKPNKVLEFVIVKTIAAFLNTNGGSLIIGVDDEGNILGLEKDYQTFSKKSRDGFLLAIINLLNQEIGKKVHRLIKIDIFSFSEKDICVINIDKSDRAVFIRKNGNEEFFIRASASSQPLGMKDALDYINAHWTKS